ncbi:hypothetical protein [Isoptericola variabilis]|uniref:Uncharacterized protein n=1 Tax=Isoptericola variabilis (strain 225) TaxID=743718 RepID=F6FQE5_ISOV2|nr:hypothetical protein [Isoptericola variabilis]AEG43820.1 hypothetical protein Isova_1037 [Isoptericola variabilis 225]TWH34120.1 hypothetical protein L600_001300000270 [Isoptericola variabilis J7]
MASTTSATAPTARRRVLHPGSVGMLVGGLMTVVGSLLPWVVVLGVTLYGTGGGGLWTLCAGFVAIAGALVPRRWSAVAHCAVAGGATAFIAGWQLVRIVDLSASSGAWGQVLPSMGLVMVAGGAVVLLRTGVRVWRTPAVAP